MSRRASGPGRKTPGTKKLASSWLLYTEVADLMANTGQQKREAAARERAAALSPKLSRLLVIVPQAARAMLPVIVSQLVVLLKDTALGYIVAYPELLQLGINVLSANYFNVIQAAIVVAVIYIVINSLLTLFAGWLERRTRRTGIRVPRGARAAGTTVEPQG